MILEPDVEVHGDGAAVLVWRFAAPVRAVSTAVLGGGVGERWWIVNATVGVDYDDPDPAAHAGRIAAGRGLGEAAGIGLLTAVDVRAFTTAVDGGAEVVATTGLGAITWAAAADGRHEVWTPGTINVVVRVPEAMADAALVNLAATITEAKVQALAEAGVPATGTPSDALVVCCPAGPPADDVDHRYGGPRSRWGARVARAAHAAIAEGILIDSTGHRRRSR
jgi:adenosylcobinamide amidohydrolase